MATPAGEPYGMWNRLPCYHQSAGEDAAGVSPDKLPDATELSVQGNNHPWDKDSSNKQWEHIENIEGLMQKM